MLLKAHSKQIGMSLACSLLCFISYTVFISIGDEAAIDVPYSIEPVARDHEIFSSPASIRHLSDNDSTIKPTEGIVTFIPYTFGFSMLIQTLTMYGWNQWKRIIIVDNSPHKDCFHRSKIIHQLFPFVSKIVITPTRLRFAQLMDFIGKLIFI